ncbi:MAG: aldehyde dehydrogenase family protein, partial [Flavobacteriia bacterium]|nr:aldehyde dehydrogenase family protein [Flavobacteriia bacterium]
MKIQDILHQFGIQTTNPGGFCGTIISTELSSSEIVSSSPVDGKIIASVKPLTEKGYHEIIEKSANAFMEWRMVPAPKRGEVVRQLAEQLRVHKEALGTLVSYEMGKSLQEGLGEVQEMIDICDFAVGLSRQLYGLTMHSERPGHRMYEQYHPLGIVGIISAFNFPVAVWNWNSALAWVCGDVCVWKPSEKTPITALACQYITNEVFKKNGVPDGVSSLVIGGPELGKLMASDVRVPL